MEPSTPAIPQAQVIFVYTSIAVILLTFVAMIVFKVSIWLAERRAGVEYRWEAPEDAPQPSRFRQWAEQQERRYTPRRYVHMSSGEEAEAEELPDPIYVPVSNISMPPPATPAAAPDMVASNADMPRLSRNITEDDELAFLCVVRNSDGKYRHSANKIFDLMGGDRNTVLAKIKAIRASGPPAEFRQPDGSTAPAHHPMTN